MMILDRVHGFANVFRETSLAILGEPEIRARILPGAFKLDASPITLNVMHAASVHIASTADASLRLWECDYGVAFEATIPATPLGAGLRSAIASGATCAMSIGFQIMASERLSSISGLPIYIVSKAALDHISICDSGAFPSARCWLDSMPVEQMQPDLAAVARRWRIGRAAHEQSKQCNLNRKPTTRAAATPAVFGKSSVRDENESFIARHDLSNYSPTQWKQLLRTTAELNSRERVRAGRR